MAVIFLLLSFTPIQNTKAGSELGKLSDSDFTEIYGLQGTDYLLVNSTGSYLMDVRTQTINSNISCNSDIRISADREYVMCPEGIYHYNKSTLTLKFNGPIDMENTPRDNNSLNAGSHCSSYPDSRLMVYNQNNPWVISNHTGVVKTIQFRPNMNLELGPYFLNENSDRVSFFYKSGGSMSCGSTGSWNWGGYLYVGYVNIGSSQTVSFNSNSGQNIQVNYNNGFSLGEIQYGATYVTGVGSNTGNNVYHSIPISVNGYAIDERGEDESTPHNSAYGQSICSVRTYDSGSVTGHYVIFDGKNTMIEQPAKKASCTSNQNMTYLTDEGEIFTIWIDSDGDSYNDLVDKFTTDSTQWDDLDGDGYGDNPLGNNSDFCPTQAGTSSLDVLGCPDLDNDGTSNTGDAFPLDSTQSSDSDGDGYGDNVSGNLFDSCAYEYGDSNKGNYWGCPDSDGDGWADDIDEFDSDISQWNDTDGDGFGDSIIGFQGDSCPTLLGNSTEDMYGCEDDDGDGWSNEGDAFPTESTQWSDRDFDGYGDNQELGAELIDSFPGDSTQWTDVDGDGHGDNPYGTEGDWFPNDPTRWQDSDQDGVADEDDAFPNEITQWNDTDGDGYGDEENGNRGDAFPSDDAEWLDSDMDGLGDNADAFPFDPTQKIDADGDGMGDNPMGIGADKFPNDATQWSDIDGDGYGDNPNGTNPDAFITDATQWSDEDGDGYGDNPSGRLYDQFPQNPTQWLDEDDDGLGDNQSGTNADPFLNDFDNDGYNDSIDPLPKFASPGDLDNDGVLDEEDLFPEDFREWADNDNDGTGDNADTDDDNDGWSDADEVREGTDPLSSSEQPVDSFEIVIPGTAVGLGAWDLIGIFGGVPLFAWIGFGFITRNGRTAKYEEKLRAANNRDELEGVARQWEYSLMLRMLGPHQGIRLERLRAELDDVFERQNQTLFSLEQNEYNQTQLVQDEMNQNEKEVPEINLKPDIDAVGNPDEKGYEWVTSEDGKNWYRAQGSKDDWVEFSN